MAAAVIRGAAMQNTTTRTTNSFCAITSPACSAAQLQHRVELCMKPISIKLPFIRLGPLLPCPLQNAQQELLHQYSLLVLLAPKYKELSKNCATELWSAVLNDEGVGDVELKEVVGTMQQQDCLLLGCVGNFRWGSGHHTLAGALQSDEDWRLCQVGGGCPPKIMVIQCPPKKRWQQGFREQKENMIFVITDYQLK